ncbi:MAG: 50S ribosomal protein L29 [Capsulimonadaceae bacterium]|nr:50S ribosomal protein L29 [Capsulimonadaceae bacterium]
MAEKKTADRLKELRGLDDAALTAAIDEKRKAIYNIRRSRLSQPESNVRETRAHRKEIARILTIRRQREIAAQQAQGAK